MPLIKYRESLVNTTRKRMPLVESPRNASITDRKAIRLFVVAGSDTQ